MNQFNTLFWISFAGASILAISVAMTSLFILGVMFRFIVLIAGFAKLESDFREKDMRLLFSDMVNELHFINHDLEKSHLLTAESSRNLEIKLLSLEGRNGTLGRKLDTMQENLDERVGSLEKGLKKVHKRKIYKEILNKVTGVETRMRGIYQAPTDTLN